MPERLLLTGASGFVGRALIGPLAIRGFELHCVTRGTIPPHPGPVRWHSANLLKAGAARALLRELRPAVLVHAAWHVVHGKFWSAPENEAWVDASEALAQDFAGAGGRRILGIGTCAEYADAAGDDAMPWPESRPLAPVTSYGRAKTDLHARLARLAETCGLSLAWARLFHLFGEGEHPDRLVASASHALATGREVRCASGRPVRDFASTRYIGEALAALAASGVTGAVNVASGEGRAVAEVVRLLGEAAGRPDLVRLGTLPDRLGEVPYMVADVTRLRQEVGFRTPPRVTDDLRALLAQVSHHLRHTI
jgi:nucleoside-diphosphate-sugar epimerase